MSFLSELKAQANAVHAANSAAQSQALSAEQRRVEKTEAACRTTWNYLSDMVRQLNVLLPDGPPLSVDGKTPWPAMKLIDFRADSRKKTVKGSEMFASVGIGWEIVPQHGPALLQRVSVNFLPELQKAESRLQAGGIQHEKFQIRHPEKKSVQAISFEYHTQADGSITATPDHEAGTITLRLCNVAGLGVQSGTWPAEAVQVTLLDELAKLVMSQPSRLFPAPAG